MGDIRGCISHCVLYATTLSSQIKSGTHGATKRLPWRPSDLDRQARNRMEILPVTDGTGPCLWSTSRTQVSQYPVQPCDSVHLSEILCHHLWLRITVNPPVLSQEPWRRTSLFYTSHLKTLVLQNTGRHKSFGGFPTARGHSNKTAMQQQEGNVYWFPSSYQKLQNESIWPLTA